MPCLVFVANLCNSQLRETKTLSALKHVNAEASTVDADPPVRAFCQCPSGPVNSLSFVMSRKMTTRTSALSDVARAPTSLSATVPRTWGWQSCQRWRWWKGWGGWKGGGGGRGGGGGGVGSKRGMMHVWLSGSSSKALSNNAVLSWEECGLGTKISCNAAVTRATCA